MDYFEFGFFDELEKIATNKGMVESLRKTFRSENPNMGKSELGARTTRAAQFAMRSSGLPTVRKGRRVWTKPDPAYDTRGFGGAIERNLSKRTPMTPAEIALHKERGRSQMEPGGLLDPNKHKTIFERRSGNDGAEPV